MRWGDDEDLPGRITRASGPIPDDPEIRGLFDEGADLTHRLLMDVREALNDMGLCVHVLQFSAFVHHEGFAQVMTIAWPADEGMQEAFASETHQMIHQARHPQG